MPLVDGLTDGGRAAHGLLHPNAGQVLQSVLQYFTLSDLTNFRLSCHVCLTLVESTTLESQWRYNPRSLTVQSRDDIRKFRKTFPNAQALCVTVAEHFTDDLFMEIGTLRFATLRSHQSVVDVSITDSAVAHIGAALHYLRAEHLFNIKGSCWASCTRLHTLKLKSMSGLVTSHFSSLRFLRSLELMNCPRLDGDILAHAPPLETLVWQYHSGAKPLTGAQLAKVGRTLKSLRLHTVQCEDMHLHGRYFPALASLELVGCTGLQGMQVQQLPALTDLFVSACQDVYSEIAWDLPWLAKLTLRECPSLSPQVLASLPALRTLILAPNMDWDTEAPIWTSEELEQVMACVNPSLRSLETTLPLSPAVLRYLSGLRTLEVDGPADLSDESLRNLAGLTHLECSGNQTTGIHAVSDVLTPSALGAFLSRTGGIGRLVLTDMPRRWLQAVQHYLLHESSRLGIRVDNVAAGRQSGGHPGARSLGPEIPSYTVQVSYWPPALGTLEVDRVHAEASRLP